MAGKPVGIVLAGVLLFLAAVVVGRLILTFGPVVLLLATPVAFGVLAAVGGWRLGLVGAVGFVLLGSAVAFAGQHPTYAVAFVVLGLVALAGLTIGWKVVRPRRAREDEP